MTLLEITPKGKSILKHIEREKNEWIELMLNDFSTHEKLKLLSDVKRLLENGKINMEATAG